MGDVLYKILIYPLKFHKFFKYGTPYVYLNRYTEKDSNKIYYNLCWYFNTKNKRPNKYNKNYSNQKYLGNRLSLLQSYKQLLNLLIKQVKNEPKQIYSYCDEMQ